MHTSSDSRAASGEPSRNRLSTILPTGAADSMQYSRSSGQTA